MKIKITDQSKTFKIEWCTWVKPRLSIVGTWVEIDE